MNIDEIIARAAPPPERTGGGAFEPQETDAEVMARRREGLVAAFGSQENLEAHAEALGLDPEKWLSRFGDVRLVGPDPDWARDFRTVAARLSDGSLPFAEMRRWVGASVESVWPEGLACGPETLEGPLDYLAVRLGGLLQPTFHMERQLGIQSNWETRFRRSPALAYALGRVIADWRADLLRIAGSAAADRDILVRAFFDGADPGALVAIEAGLGDPHAGGRSVAILRFERGAVVYKPKDLRVAATVAEIAGRLDGAGLAPPALMARDGYAWEPVYEARPVSDRNEADAFFASIGAWLAFLQALGATDFWFDNLIACGAVPRFIDFETVVQPQVEWPSGVRPLVGAAKTLIETAPSGVGILPFLMPIGEGEDPVDLGCLARPGEHRTPLPDLETGGLVVWREDRFAPHYVAGAPADAADHYEAFEEGYFRTVRILAAEGVGESIVDALRRIEDAPVRVILVDTWTCYRLIQQTVTPNRLSDGAWREIALHAALSPVSDAVGALREAAVRDLRRLDIPLFQAQLGTCDLLGVEGERQAGFFRRDSISTVQNRMRSLFGVAEDERRAWLRSSFGLRAENPPHRRPTRTRLPPAVAGDLLGWADEIASAIAGLAVSDTEGDPNWIGLFEDVFTGWRGLGPLGFDVLSGRAGLGLALLELGRELSREDLTTLACETLNAAARDYTARFHRHRQSGAGYAVGAGGLVVALAQASRPLAAEIYGFAEAREIWMFSGGDVVSGLEGWRMAAHALGETAPSLHGNERAYAPSSLPRLATWLDPDNAAPLCADRRAAACLRRDRDRHGSWFAARWLDDRHNLSGVDGLPALAVRFVRLAGEA